jgi:hypothetical protein
LARSQVALFQVYKFYAVRGGSQSVDSRAALQMTEADWNIFVEHCRLPPKRNGHVWNGMNLMYKRYSALTQSAASRGAVTSGGSKTLAPNWRENSVRMRASSVIGTLLRSYRMLFFRVTRMVTSVLFGPLNSQSFAVLCSVSGFDRKQVEF